MPMPNKAAMRNFWTQEAKEPAHKKIKNALLAAGETQKKSHKKAKTTLKKNQKPAAQGKVARVMKEFKNNTLKIGKSNKKITNRKQAVAVALSEARRTGAKIPKKSK